MTIKEMHYDFKTKLNKIDSQQYRNLRVPEIDWKLNEAQEIFVKLIAEPRFKNHLGFEVSQRNIDDIRTIVIRDYCSRISNNVVDLPQDYWFFISAYIIMVRDNCPYVRARLKIRQHDDEFEESLFTKSSFEWQEVNGVFFQEGIKVFDDDTFRNEEICMNYIKKLNFIHNAEDFASGRYRLPSGALLEGTQDCELPSSTHSEIVDIAVNLAIEDILGSQRQNGFNKLQLNQITT